MSSYSKRDGKRAQRVPGRERVRGGGVRERGGEGEGRGGREGGGGAGRYISAMILTIMFRRSVMSPHELYIKQLIEYEKNLLGKTTMNFEEYSQISLQAQLRNLRLQLQEKESQQQKDIIVQQQKDIIIQQQKDIITAGRTAEES